MTRSEVSASADGPVGAGDADRAGQRKDDRPITVLLVDDQPLLRSGFAMILSTEPDIEVVGTAADGVEAVVTVAALHPDVVLMDVQMPLLDGIEATRQILAQALTSGRPPAKIVMLTTFDRDDYLFDALDAGASGFLLKNAEADDLVEGVRTVHDGHALLAPEVTRRVIAAAHRHSASSPPMAAQPPQIQQPPQTQHPLANARSSHPPAAADEGLLNDLTAREREVLATLAAGLSNAEIATTLFLSEATVKTHVSKILAKLEVRDRVQAVIAAYRGGLVAPQG